MSKKRFGFYHIKKKDLKRYIKKISFSFLFVTFFSLSLFSIYSNVTSILFSKDKIDIIKHDLKDIALYFKRYNKEMSDFVLKIDTIAEDYFKGKNIFFTQSGNINEVLNYIKTKKNYLTKLGFEKYNSMFNFVIDGLDYKDDIFDLLGKYGERNYIVILQNTAEKRPNGGFFGSFGFISLQSGFVKNIEIIDSYYPNWIAPEIKLKAPKRSYGFIPDKLIGFISANKFGFTNIDGRNIKNLYNHIFNNQKVYTKKEKVIKPNLFEHTFNKKVHGILFVRSDIITKLIPSLKEKFWERQFINANTDIIKAKNNTGKNIKFSDKKATYIKEVNEFFEKNQTKIIKSVLKNFDKIISQKYFNIYLDEKNTHINKTGLMNFIQKNNLSTNFESGNFYFWDSNNSYNKVDTFVNKKIGLYDSGDNLLFTGINDMIQLVQLGKKLQPGKYNLKIKYYLDIPQYYKDFILSLEKKYGIEMTSREIGILGIEPAKHYVTGEEKYWATRATIYLPKNTKITNVVGDFDKTFKFYPTFANGLYYEMKILKDKVEKGIRIEFEVL